MSFVEWTGRCCLYPLGCSLVSPLLAGNCFFCWRLLGLIPGGAPFSQLSSGVKDAMVISTKVKCHFDKNMQKAGRNNTRKG